MGTAMCSPYCSIAAIVASVFCSSQASLTQPRHPFEYDAPTVLHKYFIVRLLSAFLRCVVSSASPSLRHLLSHFPA
uniref:Putative secreted peptide n=1 Tax=Anopheles braziliensis TaxID=58242 RepID=A0A2M3ZSN4_9DIPT